MGMSGGILLSDGGSPCWANVTLERAVSSKTASNVTANTFLVFIFIDFTYRNI